MYRVFILSYFYEFVFNSIDHFKVYIKVSIYLMKIIMSACFADTDHFILCL